MTPPASKTTASHYSGPAPAAPENGRPPPQLGPASLGLGLGLGDCWTVKLIGPLTPPTNSATNS
jgi:hypothetical protein